MRRGKPIKTVVTHRKTGTYTVKYYKDGFKETTVERTQAQKDLLLGRTPEQQLKKKFNDLSKKLNRALSENEKRGRTNMTAYGNVLTTIEDIEDDFGTNKKRKDRFPTYNQLLDKNDAQAVLKQMEIAASKQQEIFPSQYNTSVAKIANDFYTSQNLSGTITMTQANDLAQLVLLTGKDWETIRSQSGVYSELIQETVRQNIQPKTQQTTQITNAQKVLNAYDEWKRYAINNPKSTQTMNSYMKNKLADANFNP